MDPTTTTTMSRSSSSSGSSACDARDADGSNAWWWWWWWWQCHSAARTTPAPTLVVLQLLVLLLAVTLVYARTRSSSAFPLADRVVLITGAGSGIGRRLAETICARAPRVTLVLLDVDKSALERTRERLLARQCHRVLLFQCDVSDDSAVDACIEQVLAATERVDVLVNNAGVVSGRSLLDLSPAQIRRTLEVNTLAHFWTVRAVLPSMKRLCAREAMIVSISSVMGLTGSAGLCDYTASKAAVNAFHESLRLELQRDRVTHIHTLLVCPSAVDTGMFRGAFEGETWSLRFARLLVPLLDEQDVADSIVTAMGRGRQLLIYCSSTWRGYVFPWVPALARLLPVALYDSLLALAGGHHGMDAFVGRAASPPSPSPPPPTAVSSSSSSPSAVSAAAAATVDASAKEKTQ